MINKNIYGLFVIFNKNMKTESVIDFPNKSLCPEIWEKVVDQNGMNEVWKLIPEVKTKIMNFVQKLTDLAKLQFPNKIHITGSITSNSYTENADIDIHILGYSIREPVRITQSRFVEAFKIIRETDKESTYIGTHPFEVYYQDNEFQDYMSVGCYDFLKDEWLVGPELIDQSFNPYSEYYKEIQKYSTKLANNIRNIIFSIYELAIVYKKNINTSFTKTLRTDLFQKLGAAQQLLNNIKQSRKIYSNPESIEQALKYRSSRKWKIADASFKLFDKYGYIAILKEFTSIYNLMCISSDVDIEGINNILETVKKYLYNADKLAETELCENDKIGGISGIKRSDVENDLKYFVEEVLEDNYFDDVEVVEVWLHGSRIRGDFKNTSDLDAVVFYKGREKEDTLYNVLADESYDVSGINVDFNPIKIDNNNDIKEYKELSNKYDKQKLSK